MLSFYGSFQLSVYQVTKTMKLISLEMLILAFQANLSEEVNVTLITLDFEASYTYYEKNTKTIVGVMLIVIFIFLNISTNKKLQKLWILRRYDFHVFVKFGIKNFALFRGWLLSIYIFIFSIRGFRQVGIYFLHEKDKNKVLPILQIVTMQ